MTISSRYTFLKRAGIVAVVRTDTPEHAVSVAKALLNGGITIIELTFTTPGVVEALHEVRKNLGDAIVLGAGTIREPEQVKLAVQAGVDFLVSAYLREDILNAMLNSGLPAIPGVFTPTEVGTALDAGAEVVKLFPASTGGPDHLRALRGPFPELQVVPTGGIDINNMSSWFAQNVLAVGIGSELAPRTLMYKGRWDEITKRAERFTQAAQEARQATHK